MIRKKTEKVVKADIVEKQGIYSTTHYENDKICFDIDWTKLAAHVREALDNHHREQLVKEAPYHPGYEGAVIETKKSTKATKSRKTAKK